MTRALSSVVTVTAPCMHTHGAQISALRLQGAMQEVLRRLDIYGLPTWRHRGALMAPGHLTSVLMVPRGVRGREAIYLAPSRRHTGILGAASDLLCTLTTPYGRSRGTRPLVLCPLDAMRALSGPVFICDVPSLCHTSPAEECIWARHFQGIRS